MKRASVRCAAAVILLCALVPGIAEAVPATVLTSTGEIADGLLSGLSPVLRLLRPDGVEHVGPDALFDIPLDSIIQISLDFPRIIVETATQTLIGPYSGFLGIGEMLRLDRGTAGPVDLPTSSLRAIALNGNSLRPVPREWTGMGFLAGPKIFGAGPLIDTECDTCSIAVPASYSFDSSAQASSGSSDDGDTLVFNTLTANLPPDTGRAEIPWWLGLLGVAGVVGLFYILSSSQSPS
jgi:hypothetical protein